MFGMAVGVGLTVGVGSDVGDGEMAVGVLVFAIFSADGDDGVVGVISVDMGVWDVALQAVSDMTMMNRNMRNCFMVFPWGGLWLFCHRKISGICFFVGQLQGIH